MGFFKKLIKASNPVNQFKAAKKDPWQYESKAFAHKPNGKPC